MTNSIQIDEVFDRVLVSMTKVLTGLEINNTEREEREVKNAFVETIHTSGNFDAFISCEVEPELYEYIIFAMHGGSSPCEEEKPLYMNEFMNIICGRSVSIINNSTGYASRLSVPTFHDSLQEVTVQPKAEQKVLFYGTTKGVLRFVINYTFR